MVRLVSTHPIATLPAKAQPLYTYECEDSAWRLIGHAIADIVQSNDASEIIKLAIEENRIRKHLQAMVSASNPNIIIFEVLSRIEIEKALVSIGKYLSFNPYSEVLSKCDRHNIALVCRYAQPGVKYAINLSGATVENVAVVEWIALQMSKYRVKPEQLIFELTEQTLSAADKSEMTIAGIARLGCQISLDDFGQGFSNGSYLYRFCNDISILKIDGGLIRKLNDRCAKAVLIGYLTTAAELGLSVVCESVETPQIKELVLDIWRSRFPSIDLFLQGYGIASVEPWI